MTKRRALLRVLGAGVLSAAAWPTRGQQTSKIPRVALLFFGTRARNASYDEPARFRARLSELGYVEGKNVVIEERYAEGNTQRLNELARELVEAKVDVIVASAVAATMAARHATGTIPIVMVHAGNAASAVSTGLITSLAQPGGNVTGTTNITFGGKHVDLIRELIPRVTKLAILNNPTNAGAASYVASVTDAASRSNIGVIVTDVTRAEDFPNAFTTLRNARPDGLVVAVEPLIGAHSAEVIDFAATTRLPAIYDFGEMARRGGFIAYATVYIEHYALAADYVDKILKGAKPGDLPVQQPARFELVINLKTAKALGLTIPQSLLLRADEVIN